MLSPEQVAALQANASAPQSFTGQRTKWVNGQLVLNDQPTTQPKKKKGFWTDQISTGGSIGGALAGGAAGAAVGSVVPIVGTAVGGIAGALLGGALGGASGQVAENAITGDNLSQDVGSEALWGGATALPFGAAAKLGKAGVTVAKGLGSAASKDAAKQLVADAAVKTIPSKTLAGALQKGTLSDPMIEAVTRAQNAPTLAQKLGGKLSGAADNLAVKQFRLTPTQLFNFKNKFGEDAGQTIRKYGFTSGEDIAAKGVEPLQAQFGDIVSNIGSVSSDALKKNFDTVSKQLKGSASSDMQALGKQFSAEANGILKKYGDTIDANELNAIRREFDGLVNYTQSVANPARYGVNKRVADTLRKTLQESDPSGQLKSVGQEISKLKQLSDLTAKQGELGRGSLPVNLPGLLGAGAGAGVGGVPGAIAGAALTRAANSSVGRKAAMQTADSLVNKLSSVQPNDIGQSLKSAAIRMGGVGVARSLMGDQSSSLNTNPAMNTATTMAAPDSIPANMPSQYQETPQMSNPLGVSSAEIGQALMRAYAAGDAPAVKQLQGMYDLASQFEKSQQANPLNSTTATQIASSANATNTLDQLQGLYGAAGGGSGKIGGALQNALAGAGLSGDVQTYNDLAASSVSQLARALNGGGQVSDADAAVVIQALPKITDSPEVAQRKFAALKARLDAARQNTLVYGAGIQPDTGQQYAM